MDLTRCSDHLTAGSWRFLRKLCAGITGTDLDVRPGNYPSIRWGLDHVAVIHMPADYLRKHALELLGGALCHELLHALLTDGAAVRGIAWGLFVIANGCEDARIEHQGSRIWRGLVEVIRALTMKLLEFRRRSGKMGLSAETSKLYEIALALYLLLSRVDRELIEGTVPEMPLAVGEELLSIAVDVLKAPDTGTVVEIARRIIEQLEKAANAAAKRIGTSAASSWSRALRSEVKKAMEQTVEEMYAKLGQQRYPGYWFGPWYKGRGGYSFYTSAWNPEPDSIDGIAPLSVADALNVVAETDPLVRKNQERRHLLAGRLDTRGNGLVRAALGRDKRVFSQQTSEQRLLLLDVLGCLEIVLLMEAHNRYADYEWERAREFAITLGRLFQAIQVPFVARAWNATRAKETVHDERTGRSWERWSNNHYINIAQLKAHKERWSAEHESRVASLPREGFNQPLEGYPRASRWNLDLDRSNRKRIFLCLGNAQQINLAGGNLGYATEPLREKGAKALYLDVGKPLALYEDRRKELEAKFDGVVEIPSVPEGLAELLVRLLETLSSG